MGIVSSYGFAGGVRRFVSNRPFFPVTAVRQRRPRGFLRPVRPLPGTSHWQLPIRLFGVLATHRFPVGQPSFDSTAQNPRGAQTKVLVAK